MSTVPTDKTYAIVTREMDYWITPGQAEKLIAMKQQGKSDQSIVVNGCLVDLGAIKHVMDARTYADSQLKLQGGWQCTWGYWHGRNDKCAHGELGRYR